LIVAQKGFVLHHHRQNLQKSFGKTYIFDFFDMVRLTLANDKNKNKTENSFLILSKRHRTTLAV